MGNGLFGHIHYDLIANIAINPGSKEIANAECKYNDKKENPAFSNELLIESEELL